MDQLRGRITALRKRLVITFTWDGLDWVIHRACQYLSIGQTHGDLHIECFFTYRRQILAFFCLLDSHPIVGRVGYRCLHPFSAEMDLRFLRWNMTNQEYGGMLRSVHSLQCKIEVDRGFSYQNVGSVRPRTGVPFLT